MGLPYYENKLKDQQTDLGLALDNGDQEQANQILKEIEQTLGRIANIQTIIADLGEEWAKSHSEILIKLSEAVDKENEARNAIQGQIELTQQRIALESEKLEMLEMQKRVSRESFEADKFGGEMTLVKRHADERQKTVLKHAEREQKEIERQAKEAKERVDQIVNANPGNESVKAWGDAYKDAIDRREERLQSRLERRTDRNVKRIERERQAKEREMLDKRETDLQGRAGAEGRKADAALGAGEFAKAEEWRKKQRGTLEELQRLQMGQVNDRPLPEAEAALRRAESTQGDIDSTFDAEMVAAQQAKAKEQAYLLELQTALRELDAIKAQLADKTVVSAMDLAAADAMIAKLQTMLALKNDIADAQTAGDSVAGAAGVPGRASGGPVLAGQPYMTGEFGRELFVPSASGRIFNASDTRGMMSQVAAAIQAGDHGGRQPVTAGGSTTNFGTVNVHTMGSQTLDGLMASAATASKNARIRRS
jgi:hypothetical protein